MLLELYRKRTHKTTLRATLRSAAGLCYNLAETQQLKPYQQYERGTRLKRAVLLLGTVVPLLIIASCGSSNNSVTGPNGNVTVNAPSKLQNRAFITNQYSGNIQIMDSQNDTTAYYTVTNNNTGITGPGVTGTAVSIPVGNSLTFAVLSPDGTEYHGVRPDHIHAHFHHQFVGSLERRCEPGKLRQHGGVFSRLDNGLRTGAECRHHELLRPVRFRSSPRQRRRQRRRSRTRIRSLRPGMRRSVPMGRLCWCSPATQTRCG